MSSFSWASTSVWADLHAASPLPAARAIVVGIPALALLLYWWVTHRRDPR